MRVVAGQDQVIADWAGSLLGVRFQEPYTAFGFVDANASLRGACIFNDYYPGGNVEVTYVGPRSFTKATLTFMARFCFDELRVSRVTAKTRRGNVLMRRILPKGGFQFEGTQKRYFGADRKDDALVFVMMRDNAKKWLEEQG